LSSEKDGDDPRVARIVAIDDNGNLELEVVPSVKTQVSTRGVMTRCEDGADGGLHES
jgi:hypothetical protein